MITFSKKNGLRTVKKWHQRAFHLQLSKITYVPERYFGLYPNYLNFGPADRKALDLGMEVN